MIAWLAGPALAWETCPTAPAVHVAAGPDVLNAWPSVNDDHDWNGIDLEQVDPGWSGFGWDQQALFGVRPSMPCARLGLREQVVSHNVSDNVMWGEDRYAGSEWHLVTSPMLGGELRLPAWFAVGAYALPGVRTVITSQRVTVPERDLERAESHLTFVPTLSAYAVVRWVPGRSPVGVHVDAELPVLHTFRELAWYPHRFLGIGLDVVVDRRSAPRVEPVGERGPGQTLDEVAPGRELDLHPEVLGEPAGLLDAGDPVPPGSDDPHPVG